ncbi:MAG: 3'(2'),5'-bisphosphate nucleotidase CysQ [Deltaproteobacteria bacterium]|nr:3'(2'),5'-bisphosphate nucleotidase CysQ [Deltaproteobacteria bacterium]
MDTLLGKIMALAIKAGEEIMNIYSRDFSVEYKDDSSPLTEADKASHEIIDAGLRKIAPDIPVISEEGEPIPYSERKSYRSLWLVDPLDGTKEFIKKNGEFTVNIALIEGSSPVLGVIYVPAKGVLYYGEKGKGAFKQERGDSPVKLKRTLLPVGSPVRALVSRSHPSPEVADFLKAYNVASCVEAGSSLKFCLVAEGSADLYPRIGPTSEWDTAAGHAIAEAAGCLVATLDGKPLTYNKESLLNPGFVVSAVAKG